MEAGQLLQASQKVVALKRESHDLKKRIVELNKEKRKQRRSVRRMTAKAQKTTLHELLQIMMMKAYQIATESQASSGSASSSTEPWKPKDPKEAFEKISAHLNGQEAEEVSRFAAELQAAEHDPDV